MDELFARVRATAPIEKQLEDFELGRAVIAYLDWKRNEDGAAEQTIRGYRYDLIRLACTHPDILVGELTIEDLRWTRDLYTEASKGKATAVYKDFCKWLYEEGHTATDVAGRLRHPKKQKKPITNLFTDEEKAKIVGSQTLLRDRVCVLLLLRAGLRKTELANLRVRDIDLEHRLVLIQRGKGGKSRRIPIRGKVVEALHEFMDTEIPRVGRKPEPDDLILYRTAARNRHGAPVTTEPMASSVQHGWWYGCLERAGLVEKGATKGRRLHSTRHTYATDLGRATGWNMMAVQHNLGHANIGTTADIYSQFAFEDQEEAVDKLPEIDA